MTDLSSPETIKQLAADYAVALEDPAREYGKWCANLSAYLQRVSKTSLEERASVGFQGELWNSEFIAATGQGKVSVDEALAEDDFRFWLAKRSVETMPGAVGEATQFLTALYEDIRARLSKFGGRTPHLKIYRVLASFFPHYFTTIADPGKMARLHSAMFPDAGKQPALRNHQRVLERIDQVLGPAARDFPSLVRRMTLPWYMYQVLSKEEVEAGPTLTPLPADRRRRGMTAIRGYLNTALRILAFVGEGVERDDLLAFIRQENPSLKDNSINMVVNILRGELGLLERKEGLIVLSSRGRELVETEDRSVLAPWLLTQILGVDHVLASLRDGGPKRQRDLVTFLQEINRGWTSDFAPNAILGWLRSLEVIAVSGDSKIVELTARGREWAAMITWKPEPLVVEDTDSSDEGVVAPIVTAADDGPVEVPKLEAILQRLPKERAFQPDQVAALHAGLWAHRRRHFAIFTGLSGSGKTSLASEYARALIALTPSQVDGGRLRTVPVQPGWTDPSALLGYVNPLNRTEYVSTPFIKLLLSCAAHPTKPHVAVLDEMNLSHPEQYLAPLLSGMELDTHPIDFHDEDVPLGDVPPRLDRYPPNLVLIGTVNMDETTHGLSDKVLDRAVTLEFWDIDLKAYPQWGARGLPAELEARVRELLSELMRVLAPVRLHFGWRVVDDVLEFLKRSLADGQLKADAALDWIVYSKVVPKLRGHDSKEFREAFQSCQQTLAKYGLSRSKSKVADLARDLESMGSARFWR